MLLLGLVMIKVMNPLLGVYLFFGVHVRRRRWQGTANFGRGCWVGLPKLEVFGLQLMWLLI